eukprot:TRINITY_DN1139_c0_g1_i11.p1 TRINITY_DN1139_c0_g1~~TRINITY_DN1139_c0_g1_i11.p1  ORF type:complete len:227 (-),score=55.96 TRINITY_DN1139_c0_g1_i11:279-959(-)
MGLSKAYSEDNEKKLIVALFRLNPANDAWEKEVLNNQAIDIYQRVYALCEIGDELVPTRQKSSRNYYNDPDWGDAEEFFIGERPHEWPAKSEEVVAEGSDKKKISPLKAYLLQKEVLEANKQKLIRIGLALIDEISKNPEHSKEYRNARDLVTKLGFWGLPFTDFSNILRDQYNFILTQHPSELVSVYPAFVQRPGDSMLVHQAIQESLHYSSSSEKNKQTSCSVM